MWPPHPSTPHRLSTPHGAPKQELSPEGRATTSARWGPAPGQQEMLCCPSPTPCHLSQAPRASLLQTHRDYRTRGARGSRGCPHGAQAMVWVPWALNLGLCCVSAGPGSPASPEGLTRPSSPRTVQQTPRRPWVPSGAVSGPRVQPAFAWGTLVAVLSGRWGNRDPEDIRRTGPSLQ